MTPTPLTAWIEGIGLLAPGLPDWPTASRVLRGEEPYVAAPSILPLPAILPPAERRRASRLVKAALANNAAAVILAHNHPSGIAEPSRADEMLTKSLKEALALVDVKVLDHFIVAGNTPPLSFAERGLL